MGETFFNIFTHLKFKPKTVNNVIDCIIVLVKEKAPVTASKVQKRLKISYYSAHEILRHLAGEKVLVMKDLGGKKVYSLKSGTKGLLKYRLPMDSEEKTKKGKR